MLALCTPHTYCLVVADIHHDAMYIVQDSFVGINVLWCGGWNLFYIPSTCCRFHGNLKADALQHFVTNQLLKLLQVPAVSPHNLDKFLAKVPQHKVTVLAFSSSGRPSILLRQAAQQHERHVVAGRVQWVPEVRQPRMTDVQY